MGTGHNKEVDWWSLGILAYKIMIGTGLFEHEDRYTVYKLIKVGKLTFPSIPKISSDAKDFISGLLQKDPKERLGSKNDIDEIKKHPWLKDIDWNELYNRKMQPPLKPKISAEDVYNEEGMQD